MRDLFEVLLVKVVQVALAFVIVLGTVYHTAAQETDGFSPKPELTEVQKLKLEVQTLQEAQLGVQLQLTQCSATLTQTQAQGIAANLAAKRKALTDEAIISLGGDPTKDRLTDRLTLEPIPLPGGRQPE